MRRNSSERVARSIEALESRVLLAGQPAPLYVNAGGGALLDSIGRPFAADTGFTAGAPVASNVDFGDPADTAVFDTGRQGSEVSFSQPIPDGHYALWLEFADTQSTAAGQNVMNVSAQGQPVLSGLDVFAAAGADQPTAREFDVTITNGELDIDLTAATGNAFVNAIVALPTDVPTAEQAYSWEGLDPSAREATSASNLSEIGNVLLLYSNDHKGKMPPTLAAGYLDVNSPLSIYASPLTDTQLPQGELTSIESAAWIASRNDYIYVGQGFNNSAPPTAVAAYENPQRVAGGLNILYGDGHVGYLDRTDAAALLGFDPNAPLTGGPPITTTQQPDPLVLQGEQNLQNIGSKMILYAQENRGRYPLDPGDLIDVNANPAWFVDPRGNSPLPPAGLSGDAAKAFVNASTDYHYIAGDELDTTPPTNVLMYENPSEAPGGLMVLLMADGSTQVRETRWAMDTLRSASEGYVLLPPIAEIARPDPLAQGDSTILDGAGIRTLKSESGPFTPQPIATYQWDFNYDGNPADFQVDATGETPTFTATTLPATGQQTIALQVIDVNGVASAIATVPITITGASISGIVQTSSGAPLPGVPVYLDANNNSQLDPGEFSTTTNATGSYSFTNIPAGAYIVRQILTPGTAQNSPSNNYGIHLSVAGDTSLANENFTDTADSISGTVMAPSGPLAGVTVYLDANNNSTLDGTELSTTTAADGTFSFTAFLPGAYIIRQVLPGGYVQATPTNGYGIHLTVNNGAIFTNENFQDAVIPAGGELAGQVTIGSAAVAGETVYLDANNNSQLDPGELYTTTDSSGNYSFTNVPPGAFIIRQLLAGGVYQLTPTLGYGIHVTVASGGALTSENFTDAAVPTGTASIAGAVFNDANANGIDDPTETGLAGWTVYLDLTNSGIYQSGDPTATTDSSGDYLFSDLAAGNYIVRVERPGNYAQTSPLNNFGHHIALAAGQATAGVNFGEKKIA